MEALMLLQCFIDGMIRRDVVSLVSLLHEDFLYLEDASLETRDEWIESIKFIGSASWIIQRLNYQQGLRQKIWVHMNTYLKSQGK